MHLSKHAKSGCQIRIFKKEVKVNKREYSSLLGQLPIKSPTHEDMARFCPHISKEQAVKSFLSGSGIVACPSLFVRNGYQILSYQKEWVETVKVEHPITSDVIILTKNHPARLSWFGSGRTIESYKDRKPHGDVFHNYKHIAEAINFANSNWGEALVLDDWEAVMEIYLQDPSDLVNDRYHDGDPRTKMVIYLALNRDLNSIINDRSRPESDQLNDAIVHITNDQIIWAEIRGGRGQYTEFNCARCGSGLGLNSCSGCGYCFHDNLFRCGWRTPLPKKITNYATSVGHTFAVSPKKAIATELRNWKKYSK